MNILFLSHYFPPEVNAPASRTYDHCCEWVKAGHSVDVITCAPNHPRGKVYPGYTNKLYQKEEKAGIQVHRVWTYLTANEGFLKRTANYLSFMCAAIACALFMKKPSVVLSTSPQFFNGLAGYFVSRLRRVPWVLEIRDLWPDSILAVGAIKNKNVIKLLKGIELFCYRKATHIVVVTDSFAKYMKAQGVPSEKISVIKNGANLDLFSIIDPEKSNAEHIPAELIPLRTKFVAAYVGTHGMAHHLETVLEAAKLLAHEDQIHFLLVGDGAEREKLFSLKNSLNLTNVTMMGQQPKEMMPAIWRVADISLVVLRKTDLFETVIPSKIFESLAMKKPIVLGVRGEVANMIAASGAGIEIEPENAFALSKAVIRFAKDKDFYIECAESGYRYVHECYDRKKLASQFEKLLCDVSSKNLRRVSDQSATEKN